MNRRAVLKSLIRSDDGKRLALGVPTDLYDHPPRWEHMRGRKAIVCLMTSYERLMASDAPFKISGVEGNTIVVAATVARNLRARAPLPTEATPQPTDTIRVAPTRREVSVMVCDPVVFDLSSFLKIFRWKVPLSHYSVSWMGEDGSIQHMASPFGFHLETRYASITMPFTEGLVTFAPNG